MPTLSFDDRNRSQLESLFADSSIMTCVHDLVVGIREKNEFQVTRLRRGEHFGCRPFATHMRNIFIRFGRLFHNQLRRRDSNGDTLPFKLVQNLEKGVSVIADAATDELRRPPVPF